MFISFRNFSVEVAANTYSIELNPSSIINKSAQDEARLVAFEGLLTQEKIAQAMTQFRAFALYLTNEFAGKQAIKEAQKLQEQQRLTREATWEQI